MYAKRLNKVYPVNTPQEKKDYLSRGFDIVDNEGNVIVHSPQKTVPFSEYARVLKENQELKAQLGLGDPDGPDERDPLEGMSTDDLKKYAADNGIDVGSATTQKGILKKIREAEAADSGDDGDDEAPKTLNPGNDGSPKMGSGSPVQA